MNHISTVQTLGGKLLSVNKVFLILGIVLLCCTDFFQSEVAPIIVGLLKSLIDKYWRPNKDFVGVKAKFKRNEGLRASAEAFLDDSKSRIATEDELEFLEKYGYDKYRYVSKSFMKRNKLLKKR